MNALSVAKKSVRARHAEVGALRVSDVAYRADFTSPPHIHAHDCLTLVLAGDMGKTTVRCAAAPSATHPPV